MKKTVLALVCIGTAVVLWLVVHSALAGRNKGKAHGPEVVRVARGDIGTIVKATGVVRPTVGAEVRVGAQQSGILQRLFVKLGDRVHKGQLLAQLDRRELVARRDQAAAALQSAEASQRWAAADLARKRALATEKAIPVAELDLAERAASLARADTAQARANLALAETHLDQARITAPIAGVVASIATKEGETVAAGLAAPTFLTIIDLERLEVWAYVDETDIGRVRVGQSAHFTVDAYPDHAFEGEIAAIYPKPEIRDNVVDYLAVVRFASQRDWTLRPEMTTNVRIALQSKTDVLSVPRRAVRSEQGRFYVLVPQANTFARRYVMAGSRDETRQEIVEGLKDGDEVLLGELPDGTTMAD